MECIKITVILTAIALLISCATPYQPKSFMGGYTDSRIDSNTARVTFYGNGHTSRETVENDMLYRCAQVTLNDGYDYFVIVEGETTPTYSSFTTPGTYNGYTNTNVNVYGNTGYTTSTTTGYYQPGQTFTTQRFQATVIIKMFKGQKPAGLFNAYNAKEILSYINPQQK
jgi:hypothetical protein